jgi:hypothetical protein
VSYHGVHVEVPASWPVVDGMHTLMCDSPFPRTPTAFVGPQLNAPSACAAPLPRSAVRHYGVWLHSAPRPTVVNANLIPSSSGGSIAEEGLNWDAAVNVYWYRGVEVDIGFGPDPSVGDAILRSIAYTPHLRDSPRAQACSMSPNPNATPTAERVNKPLVLEQGQVTLDPPMPSDRAATTAAAIWTKALAKQPFESHRLLLTRYSAKFPAKQNPNGSFTPVNQNVLSWVEYSAPLTQIPGCGTWGVEVFDATSGTQIISSSWSPGP